MRNTINSKIHLCLVLSLLVVCIMCNACTTKNQNTEDIRPTEFSEQIALTESILVCFQQEKFDEVEKHFSNNMRKQLSKEQLAVLWAQLNSQFGKFSKSRFYSAEKLHVIGDKIVYQCDFGSQQLYFQLVFGKDNRISGLFFKTHPN